MKNIRNLITNGTNQCFGIFPLFIFFFSLFLSTCSNPLDLPRPEISEGSFILDIGGSGAARTIIPIEPGFAAYSLVFTSGGETLPAIDRSSVNIGNPVNLQAKTWDLTVTAYLDAEKTKPAARGSLEGIVITAGAVTQKSIELHGIIESGATGTFEWKIDYPANVVRASVTITPLDDATGTATPTLFFTGSTPTTQKEDSVELNTGYYRAAFYLDTADKTFSREEYLHIYKDMKSVFEFEFTSAHFVITLCDHQWGDYEATAAPTCVAKGSETRTCSECEREETREIPVDENAHSWIDNWVIIEEATETEAGLKRRFCDNGCGEHQDQSIPATTCDHQWGDYAVTTHATCVAKGSETRTCSVCGGDDTQEIPIDENAHSWIENWQVTVLPTCSALGTRTRTCAHGCGETENLGDVAIDGNAHSYQWTVTTPPSCAAEGEETGECTYNPSHAAATRPVPIDPDAHQISEWTLDVNIGLEKTMCPLCGAGDGTRPISSVANVTAYLTHSDNNGTLDEPLPLKVEFDLGVMTETNSNWQQLLTALSTARDYIELDLSNCTMNGTEFVAGAGNSTNNQIVSIVLPDAALSIPNGTSNSTGQFRYYGYLKTVSAKNLTTIGDYAFYNLSMLTSVDFPAVTSIGYSAFASLDGLTSVNFPAVLTIGDYAFNSCKGLTSVNFPLALSIGGNAFRSCENLTRLNFASVQTINNYAFGGCNNLTNITFSANNLTSANNTNHSVRFTDFIIYYNNAAGGAKRAGDYSWNGTTWVYDGSPAPPAKLESLSTTISSSSSIKLTWTVVSGTTATSYRIERRTGALGDFEQIASGITALTYTDEGLTYGGQYYYRVYAVNAAEESEYTQTSRLIAVPATPTNVKVSASTMIINLGWESANADASYLVITPNIGSPVTKTGGRTSYSSVQIANETSQTIEFYTYNGAGRSPESVTITAKFENPPAPPAAPTGFTATATTSGIQLSWSASSGATSYEIHRSTSPTSGFTAMYTQSSSPYTDRYVTGGTTYYYRIYAQNSGGNSTNYASANATATAIANTSLEGTWLGTGAFSGTSYTFNSNGTTNFNGVTMYTWRYSGSNAIILSYASLDSDPISFSISGNTMTLSGNSNILLAGTYTKQ